MITITGRLTKDPEIKYYESGKIKTTFSVAVDRYNPKTKQKEGAFFNCEIWDKQGEFVAEHFKKGSMISLYGYIKVNEYEKDGNTKKYTVVNVLKAGFTGAFTSIQGEVKKAECRNLENGAKKHILSINDVIVNAFSKDDFNTGDCVACEGTFCVEDNKVILEAIKVERIASQTSENKGVVKFAEEEFSNSLIDDEDIPF